MEKKMSLIQLLVALTLAAASVLGFTMTTTKGTAYLSETAELKCNFQIPENLEESSNLAYYWQNAAEEVLYELDNGKPKTEYINQKYKNRTTFQSNLNLLLHKVTLQDRRTYKCIVFNTTGWKLKIHECVHKLDVIVNITIPKIGIISNRSEKFGHTIKLECSSRLCYPHPEGIIWTIHNSSGTFKVEGENPNIQNDTQIFTITSDLTIYVDVNTTISCMIKANHSLKSEPQEIVINAAPLPDDGSYTLYIWIALGCLIGLLAIIAIAIFVVRRLKTEQRSPAGSNQQNGHVNDIQLVVNPRSNSDTPAERNSLLNGVEPHA